MTRRIVSWSFVVLFLLMVSSSALAITKEEIITLAQLGISADEIIKAIEKDKTIFKLEINDILELKNAGVPEAVIRFMLATPQRFGEVKAPEETTPKPEEGKPAEQPKVEEKTPEEIKAEAERARLEALRLKEEQEKAAEAQKRIYAQGQLKGGMELAAAGKYVAAIQHFRKFIADGNYPPE